MAGTEPKLPTSIADDVPTVSVAARVLGWCLWFGMPAVLVVAAIVFVRTGWPALILIAVLPPAAGLLALGLWGLRQPAITGWDHHSLYLRSNGKSEPVPWENVEWFHKLLAYASVRGWREGMDRDSHSIPTGRGVATRPGHRIRYGRG